MSDSYNKGLSGHDDQRKDWTCDEMYQMGRRRRLNQLHSSSQSSPGVAEFDLSDLADWLVDRWDVTPSWMRWLLCALVVIGGTGGAFAYSDLSIATVIFGAATGFAVWLVMRVALGIGRAVNANRRRALTITILGVVLVLLYVIWEWELYEPIYWLMSEP